MSRLKIFTWHIHGSYLYYLSQGNYDIYIPVNEAKTEGYYGKGETFPFGDNVHEVDAAHVRDLEFDLILFQTDDNYLYDQYHLLSDQQRNLPKIYLEHDPPWGHPTDNRHPVTNRSVTLVHVTHFNQLMWDNHGLDTKVIAHGVLVPEVTPKQRINKGIVVINNLPTRGRLLGLDIFNEVREHVPMDLVGMGAESYGIGEVLHPDLPEFVSQYTFFFNPIRYTSLGLAVCEAMMLGLPVVGLATTEMAVTIQNGYSGYVHTNINYLVDRMLHLLENNTLAREMGRNAKAAASDLFSIKRFCLEWEHLFHETINKHLHEKQNSFY